MINLELKKKRIRFWTEEQKKVNKLRSRQWQINNPVRHREIVKRSQLKNKDKYSARQYARHKERLKTDKVYALKISLRIRLNQVLAGREKKGSAVELLGCSGDELVLYLESRFQEGMSWSNRSEWHIDHIIPLSKFDLQNPDELAKACHYTNLQPLWAIDNFKKGNK